ncbi:hypothetical protein [Microbacterium sp. ZW T5_56]|uniref:hypothetical protein n=1 Tax=Microbacterium sp. ZW T5_56 TaxID=3378081 RepID=UPI003853EBF2
MSTPESSRIGNHDEGTVEMTAHGAPNVAAAEEQLHEPPAAHDASDLAVDTAHSAAAPTPAEDDLTHVAPTLSHTVPAPPAAVGPQASPALSEVPRTRWGGIIWGLVFLAIAGVGFWSTSALSAEFLADIWLRITPLAVGAGMVLIVGAIALLCALVALARHLQRRSAAQRSPL